jgi:hypothetical protein
MGTGWAQIQADSGGYSGNRCVARGRRRTMPLKTKGLAGPRLAAGASIVDRRVGKAAERGVPTDHWQSSLRVGAALRAFAHPTRSLIVATLVEKST